VLRGRLLPLRDFVGSVEMEKCLSQRRVNNRVSGAEIHIILFTEKIQGAR